MVFPFHTAKATEVAAEYLRRSGGTINIMKLLKLMYLTDRIAIKERGLPIVGGTYFSMKNGPVPSEVLDLINAGRIAGESDTSWEDHITDRKAHDVSLTKAPDRAFLSDGEIEYVERIWAEHGSKNQWELVDWCHNHCPEWSEIQFGAVRIGLNKLASAVGRTESQRRRMMAEAKEQNALDRIFA